MKDHGALLNCRRADSKNSIGITFVGGIIFILMLLFALCGCHSSSDSTSNGGGSNTTVTYSTGVLDSSGFNNPNGFIVTQADRLGTSTESHGQAVALQSDGKIVVAGWAYHNGDQVFAVARYKTDGTLDTTFNTSGSLPGVVNTAIGNNAFAYAVAIQSNGKIVVAGSSSNGGSPAVTSFALARYNTDGTLDTGFGSSGIVIQSVPGGDGTDVAYALAIQSDGKIIAAGYSTISSTMTLAALRFSADGTSVDTTFGPGSNGAFIASGLSGDSYANGVAIQSDSKIVLAGTSSPSGKAQGTVIRLFSDGTLDTSFNSSGITYTGVDGTWATALVLQSDGKIVIGGNYWDSTKSPAAYSFYVARFTTDGVLDTVFGTSGLTYTAFGSYDDICFALAIQSGDQKIVAGGYSTDGSGYTAFALVRYNTDGSLDTSFNTVGKVTTYVAYAPYSHIYGIAIQSDGKIVAAGDSDYYYNSSYNYYFAVDRYGN